MCPECKGNLLDGNHRVETFRVGLSDKGFTFVTCPKVIADEIHFVDSITNKKILKMKGVSM